MKPTFNVQYTFSVNLTVFEIINQTSVTLKKFGTCAGEQKVPVHLSEI
jgi:hypothetical protein